MSRVQNDEQELNHLEKILEKMHLQIDAIAQSMEQARIAEYTELLLKPWRLIWLNVLSGIAKGVGIAIGFSVFAATIVYILQWLNLLNLPIVGDYIADLVRVVQRQLEGKTY